MALMDSGVNAAFIWMLFFSILLIREKRLDIALIFGLGAGLASLSKSTVRLFFFTSFFAPVLIWTRKSLNEKRIKFIKDSFNYYMLFGLACFVAFAIYNVQRLSQFFHYVSGKNNTFIMTFEQFFDTPFKYLGQNLVNIPVFFSWEMGFIIPLLGVAGFLYLYKQDKNLFTYFLIWFAVPYIVISFFAIVLFPRYVIYLGTIFLITATYYLSSIKVKQLQTYIILISLSVLPLLYTIWFDHANIPFPEIDRGQYIEGWPAGWGAKEVMDFAKEQSKEKTVLLIVEGTFGMSGDVFNVLKGDDPNIMVQGEWPLNKESLEEHRDKFKGKKVYVVFSHRTEFPEDWPIEKIKVYDRPGDKARIALFEVIEY
jgi:4-amino-4-deoxy-L-arabinose transferase-like glycosyltransferase